MESLFRDPISHFWKSGTGTTIATTGAPTDAEARWLGDASSFQGCSAHAALPADRPGGRQEARAAAARSPREEVVAGVPSTPHRVVEVTAVFLGLEVVVVIAAVKVGGNKVIKASQKHCQAMVEVVEGKEVGIVKGEVSNTTTDLHPSLLLPVSASAPAGTLCHRNPCAGSCSVMSRARAVTMKR